LDVSRDDLAFPAETADAAVVAAAPVQAVFVRMLRSARTR